MMTLSQYLDEHGISLPAFAAQVGVHHVTIWRYAAGKALPSVPTMVKIRDATAGAVDLNSWAPPLAAPDASTPEGDAA